MRHHGAAGTVIVGGSAAGLAVAEGLRRGGSDGPVTVISDEFDTPYDRPPLSKQVLAGSWLPHRAALLPARRFEALRVRFLLGSRVAGADLGSGRVTVDSGWDIDFDDLVIATGVRPRTFGTMPKGVQVLRTMTDALALRERLTTGSRLAIIGAGFLGLEVAATAAAMGATVDVVEPVARPLATRLGEDVARRLMDLHAAHGVRVRCGVSVSSFADDGNDVAPHVTAVRLNDGTSIAADTVLLAIGCTPAVDWLEGTGLDLGDGVLCDEYCRAAPGVWAAGDVARSRHPRYGVAVRYEHRAHATEQGLAVGRSIAGSLHPFDAMPYFWTDHFDVKIQVVGSLPPDADHDLVEGDIDGTSFALKMTVGGELVGALTWNAPRTMTRLRRELSDMG